MVNSVVLVGRLVVDTELRYTSTGIPVANFRLAVDRIAGGDKEKQTDFINCVAWRQSAEFMGNYGAKGRLACVEGRLEINQWTDKEGRKRYDMNVVANRVKLLDRKPNADKEESEGDEGPPNEDQTRDPFADQ